MSTGLLLLDIWHVCGVVKTRRELTSQKNANWRGYILGIAGMGSTFELEVTKDLFGKVAEGEHLLFSGRIDNYNGKVRLVCDRIMDSKQAPAFLAGLDVIQAKDKTVQAEALKKFNDSAAKVFQL